MLNAHTHWSTAADLHGEEGTVLILAPLGDGHLVATVPRGETGTGTGTETTTEIGGHTHAHAHLRPGGERETGTEIATLEDDQGQCHG